MAPAIAAASGPALSPGRAGRRLLAPGAAAGTLVRSSSRRRRLAQLIHFRRRVGADERRRFDDREVEAEQQPRARRQFGELARDDLGRFADDFASALPAERAADAREEQPHVVVDLGRRADRGSRIPDAVLLPDRDGGRDAVDAVDIGFLHALEKLPRVRRQRLDVAALPFRVDRVEGQRRLPRSADAGHDDELAGRQRQIDVLEVVRAGAAHDEIGLGGHPRGVFSGVGHAWIKLRLTPHRTVRLAPDTTCTFFVVAETTYRSAEIGGSR